MKGDGDVIQRHPQRDHELTLAEAVALVGGFDARTGNGIRPGLFSHGNIHLAESTALLIALADDGCVELQQENASQLIAGAATARVLAGSNIPSHPVLIEAHRVVLDLGKPITADRLLPRIDSRPVHERLIAAGLVARTGRVVRRDSLTTEGMRMRMELCAEIERFTAPDTQADASEVSEFSALLVAVLLAGLVAHPLYSGQDRRAAIEKERHFISLRERVASVGSHAPHRAGLLTALSIANAGMVT